MIDRLIKALSLIVLATFFMAVLSGCEKSKEPDYESIPIEIGKPIMTNDTIADLNRYDVLYEKTFNRFGDLFKDNREVFTRTVDLMLSQEVDTSIFYDFDNHSISKVYVFNDNGFGHSTKADKVFSDSELNLLLSCLKIMASIVPEDTRSISISRESSSSFYPLGVDFKFRSDLNIDYGYIFTEYQFSSYKEVIENNWYTYMYGLV